jgi:two-component system, chemotaxis family, protein-glutamate methylesterase/glutaminase
MRPRVKVCIARWGQHPRRLGNNFKRIELGYFRQRYLASTDDFRERQVGAYKQEWVMQSKVSGGPRAPKRDIVVIGASLGGVQALRQLAADLPAQFPASVLVVQHIGANPSTLPALLTSAGSNPASHAQDGEPLRQGHIIVAPPDHHLLIRDGKLKLSRGPKEHFSRPAVDTLFRSAAIECGPRIIGVVLTGTLDDGTAGLQAIKQCGGTAVVQDPASAFASSMPASALRYAEVDYCLPLEQIAGTLLALVGENAPRRPAPPPELIREQAPWTGTVNAMKDLAQIASPSPLTCPECGGGLWEINQARPPRFRCHTGHGYSLQTLQHAMRGTMEALLWAAERALQADAAVSHRMAEELRKIDNNAAADEDAHASADERKATLLRRLIEEP